MSPSGRNPPATRCAGSTPARRTSEDRPVRLSVEDASLSSWKDGFNSHTGHLWPSGETGKHATLRLSCRKAWEFDSPLGHSLTQVSQCSVEPHKLGPPGATPGPATFGRVRKLAKRRGREPRDFVGSTPTQATDPVVQRLRRLDDTQERDGSTPSGIIRQTVCRCFRRHTSSVRRKTGFESRTDPPANDSIKTVQREDAWRATRRSGFVI